MRKTYTISIIFLICAIFGCTEREVEFVNESVSFDLDTRAVPPGLMSNIRLFMFDGDNRNNANGQYYREILNISRANDKMTMDVEAGFWNIGLVSCEDDPLAQLVTPVRGAAPENILMWKTEPVGGVLPNTPDIRTDLLSGVNVVPNVAQNKSTSLDRHVGMVRILLTDGVGFQTGSGHAVYLKNVPTSLSWGGSLYPDKTNPVHSGNTPMNGTLTFVDAGGGHQKSSDVVEFIVPTHKSANDNDTTTHKLTLGVKFNTLGGTLFEKEILIDRVPRDNRILQVNLTAKGGVEVKTEIADWNVENSTISPKLYTMQADGYISSSSEWVYHLTMNQERNWWMTLGGTNPECFEFVDSSASSGQLGTTTIRIKRSSLHPGGSKSATLSLYISGYGNAVESWNVQD